MKCKDDWRADGYRWKQTGCCKIPRGSPVYSKLHYATVTSTGTSTVFQKFVYKDLCQKDVVVIHYMGNHHLAVLMPHGNSKKAINFLTTASSVRSAIVESKNYKEMLIDVKDEPIQFQPRNPRQFKYIRSVESAGKRLGVDSFVTLHELAYMMPGFVWTVSTYPDLAVSFGIQKSIEQLVMCSQVFFSYDTTFNLGDFYLSILVAQMSYFVEKPCMPIAFLLHDQKFDIVHKFFFKTLKTKLPILNNVVIVTDGESGLSKAIEKALPKWNLVTCSNHILSDIEIWLKKHNAGKQEISVYKSQVQELLQCESESQLQMKIDTLKLSWSEAFVVYFENHLSARISIAFIGYLRSVGLIEGLVTNNISESLNALIKRFQEWEEAPVDAMLIAMHRLQTFYLTEIKRSFSGFGPYTLNENTHLSINIDEVPKLEDPELVIAELQAAANVSLKQLVPPSISVLSNMLTVVHNPSIKVFTVSGPDGNAHVVKLFPKESCTCPSSTMCCHVLAVKRSIGVECSERRVLNLTKLRGNSRKKGDKKSGRKKPRPGDINFIPAPDAIGAINNLDLSSFDDFSLIQNNDAKVSPTLVGIDYLHADNIATAIPLAKSKMKQKQLKLVDAYVPKKRQPSASLVSSDFQSLLYSDVIPIVNVELECIVPVDVDDWLQFNTTSVSIADRNLITSPDGLLNDKVIYAAMILCKQQFLDVDGLEDPILCFAGQCNSVPLSKRGYVQIFNDETKGHWITVANQHCKDGKINIYCSLQLIPSKECTHSISKFARIQCAVMELHINNVSRQREMLCGFYTIANCVSLCLGKDPCNFTYRESVMRQHLLACLENKYITQFPVESFRTVRKSVIRISRNTLYCVCRTIFMSSGSMVQCKLCNEWFHSSCIGLSEELFIEYKRDIQKIYKCAKCI